MGYKEYELLIARILRGISRLEGISKSKIQHNVQLTGLSGACHQIDVYWEFELAGTLWKTVIQAKDWNHRVDLPTVNTFRGVLQDLGNPRGMMFTRTGYDKGNIEKVAEAYNIALYVVDDFVKMRSTKAPSLSVLLVGEDVSLTLTNCRFSEKYDPLVLGPYMENLHFDNLTFREKFSGKIWTADQIKDAALYFAIQNNIGSPEGAPLVYKPPAPLTIITDRKPQLEVIEFHGVIRIVETSRKQSTSFVTHLVQLATGDTKFFVDNSFQVHRAGELSQAIRLGDKDDDTLTIVVTEQHPHETE